MEQEKEQDVVWGWSTCDDDGFVGAYPSKEHAIAAARDNLGTDFKYSNVYVQPGSYECVTTLMPNVKFLTEHFIERLGEDAYEECGELAEGWPDVSISKEAEEELETGLKALLEGWMKKHLKMPAWASVAEPELVHKAEED